MQAYGRDRGRGSVPPSAAGRLNYSLCESFLERLSQ